MKVRKCEKRCISGGDFDEMADRPRRFTPFMKQCFVTAAVCTNVVGHGAIVGYPTGLLPQLQADDSILPITDSDASWIASILGISMLIGIFMTPPVMGRLGRKAAHYTVILSLLASWCIFSFANSIWQLMIARVLQGLSFGMFMPLRSVLIGEYTSPRNRGAFLATISLAQGLGIMLVHLFGSYYTWQTTALICVFIALASLLMTYYSPESPSWLADRGKFDECRKVFHWLRGYDEEDELDEMIKARYVPEKEVDSKFNLKSTIEVALKKEFYKPIIVMVHMYVVLSFSGSMTIAAFSTTILKIITGPIDIDFWMLILDTQRLFTSSLSVYIINRTKRRAMTFATLGLCIFSHIAISGYVYGRDEGLITYTSTWLPLVLVFMHYLSIAFGMVPLPSVIAGEIFPLAYRSLGNSISMVSYAAFMFVALKTFTGLVSNLGLHGTYLVYAVILIYCMVIIGVFMPETRGKTLQQIEDEFKGKYKHQDDFEAKQPLKMIPSQTIIEKNRPSASRAR